MAIQRLGIAHCESERAVACAPQVPAEAQDEYKGRALSLLPQVTLSAVRSVERADERTHAESVPTSGDMIRGVHAAFQKTLRRGPAREHGGQVDHRSKGRSASLTSPA